jgi:glycosyltransferase involved in cell wall biosynthesis
MEECARIVGLSTLGYPEVRNIAGLPFTRYRARKFQNLYKIPAWFHYKIWDTTNDRLTNSFRDLDLSPCDLYHFFNGISYGRKPWLTTFETVLPRWGPVGEQLIREGVELLAGKPCKKILALSECTATLQREHLQRVAPDIAPSILGKLAVMHPPQALKISGLSEKKEIKRMVSFIFVGGDFFLKGGREMIQSLDMLHKEGYNNWHLTIISPISTGYINKPSESNIRETRLIISSLRDHITHYDRLPNNIVLSLFRESHVALLPTWAETYGYSVLEAQASGTPVITTNIRALPEINNDTAGWLLPVKLNSKRNAELSSAEDRTVFATHLRHILTEQLRGILSDPSCISIKAEAALDRIRQFHDPKEKANILERYYEEALG